MEVFARVQLVAEIDAGLIEEIENREPATAELRKGFVDEPGWALRPRIKKWPRQGAGKRGMRGEPHPLAGPGGITELLDCPRLAGAKVLLKIHGRKISKKHIIGWMRGNKLALQMGG